jgi:superfamily II DNA/RNA helicase
LDFYDLDLNDYVLDALDDMNFTDTTPIQEHAIPPILEGRDVMGVAQTGTGKTAAYLLPVLSLLADGNYPKDAINCVIMSPTRELAQQIDSAMQGFAYYLNDISSVAVYGGNDGIRYEQEKRAMQSGADVVIATPGRLISHLSLGNIDLSRVSFFILDEADRMLDMGFCDDILLIAKTLPQEHQTIMFSATMPGDILSLAHNILRNPVEVKLAVSKPADNIRQSAYICYEPQKLPIVKHILNNPSNFPLEEKLSPTDEPDTGSQKESQNQGNISKGQELSPSGGGLEGSVIIFVGSKKKTKELAISIIRAGYNARAMHSDLTQAERDEVMYLFRSRKIDILVATDIVARGIDIDDIAIVINFDVPHDEEDYVHRIGRTARAGRGGRAVTLVNEKDMHSFRQIERFLGKEIKKEQVPEELGETPVYVSRNKGHRASASYKRASGPEHPGKGKNHGRRYYHNHGKGKKNKRPNDQSPKQPDK